MRGLYGVCLLHILCLRVFCYTAIHIKSGDGNLVSLSLISLILFQHCAGGTASGAGLELVGIQISRAPVAVTAASEGKEMVR